jgi:hypothetical protein
MIDATISRVRLRDLRASTIYSAPANASANRSVMPAM